MKKKKISQKRTVSILIPARNEEENLPCILKKLDEQTYMNFELIVYNDQSTDKTAEVFNGFETSYKKHLIMGEELPDGWNGKNHACYKLANSSKSELFLFLDADVDVTPDFLEKIVSNFNEMRASLISIFPVQKMETISERLTIPIMNHILLSLLPLKFVYWLRKVSFSAANGQVMLFDAKIYNQMQPHLKLKNRISEDIETVRYFKKSKLKTAVFVGNNDVYCRMYKTFKNSIDGFSKNYIDFFGGKIFLTSFFLLFSLLGLISFLFIGEFKQEILLYLSISYTTKLLTTVVSRQNLFYNLVLFIPQSVISVFIGINSILKRNRGKVIWKNREV